MNGDKNDIESVDQTSQSKDEESWKDSDFLCFDDSTSTTTNNKDNDDDYDDDQQEEGPCSKKQRLSPPDTDQTKNQKKNKKEANLNTSLDSIILQRRYNKQKGGENNNSSSSLNASIRNNDSATQQRLPPWMDRPHQHKFHYNTPKLILLHDEIVQFVNLMKPQPAEIEARNEFVERVKDLILNLFNGKINQNGSCENKAANEKKGVINNGGENDGEGKCEVHVFGSMATGLILPSSDIDFVVMLPNYESGGENDSNKDNGQSKRDASKSKQDLDNTRRTDKKGKDKKSSSSTSKTEPGPKTKQEELKEMQEYDIRNHLSSYYSDPLQLLAHELKTKWKNELTYIEVVENTKVPIIKFTHGPTNLSADICFNQYNGVQAAELMKRFMDVMPPLKPLTFILKYFMAVRGLNEPYSGGCGSFMIQLMIVSFLQHRERYDYNNFIHDQQQYRRHRYNDRGRMNGNGRGDYESSPMNLGSLLLEFFELYGMDFNYLTTAISVRHDGYYFPKGHHNRREYFFINPSRAFTLGIENPIDITMDVGKPSFRMPLIQKSYEVALRVLLSHVSVPAVPTDSILASIIPPTEEMYKRATMNKVLRQRSRASSDASMEMSESE